MRRDTVCISRSLSLFSLCLSDLSLLFPFLFLFSFSSFSSLRLSPAGRERERERERIELSEKRGSHGSFSPSLQLCSSPRTLRREAWTSQLWIGWCKWTAPTTSPPIYTGPAGPHGAFALLAPLSLSSHTHTLSLSLYLFLHPLRLCLSPLCGPRFLPFSVLPLLFSRSPSLSNGVLYCLLTPWPLSF